MPGGMPPIPPGGIPAPGGGPADFLALIISRIERIKEHPPPPMYTGWDLTWMLFLGVFLIIIGFISCVGKLVKKVFYP
jgi:hypothetical protein